MLSFRSAAVLTFAAAALAAPAAASADPVVRHVPAPLCVEGAVPVRGVVVDDGHTNEIGKGHTVHGNGFGYGHSCGGDTTGGGGDNT